MLWIMLVLFIVGEAVDEETFVGICPRIKNFKNFNVTACMGDWYEAAMYSISFKNLPKCVTTHYHLEKHGSVKFTNKLISTETGLPSTIRGIATPIGDPSTGEFAVTYESLPNAAALIYYVLGTNYVEWLVLWSCTDDGTFSTRHSRILTRARHPTGKVLLKAYKTVKSNNINRVHYHKTVQDNCP